MVYARRPSSSSFGSAVTLLLLLAALLLGSRAAANDDGDDDEDPALLLEYDAHVLDPHSVHGTPYGGFGRATRSRLAALPLWLPPVSERQAAAALQQPPTGEDGRHSATTIAYAQVRDASGRPFACRVYLEDELDPASLSDGMFVAPRLRQRQQQQQQAQQQQPETATATNSAAVSTKATASSSSSSSGGDSESSRLLGNAQPQQGGADSAERSPRDGGTHTAATPAGSPSGSGAQPHVTNQQQQQQQQRDADANTAAAGDVVLDDPTMAFAPAGARRAAAAEAAAAAANDDSGRSSNSDDDDDDDTKDTDEDRHKHHHTAEQKALIRAQLAELEGVCGQIHRGYWSYEWCFEKGITQYHIEYSVETNAVEVEQVTHLGTFQSRRYHIGDLPELPPNELAEDVPELARVADHHTQGGDACPGTGRPRQSHVHLQCCSGRVMARRRGMLHRDGHPLPSSLAALWDVHEDDSPDRVCVYNVTVCTPLLCGEEEEPPPSDGSKLDAGSSSGAAGTTKLQGGQPPGGEESGNADPPQDDIGSAVRNEILSVLNALSDTSVNEGEAFRSILDRTLANLCLQTNSGGWWIYEYCHKEQIRQFHEVTALRKSASNKAAVPARVVETEHILGRYNPVEVALEEDDIVGPEDEEWKLVVNATAENKVYGDGNGAYYEVEYTGGDVCDHSDVTESAIVAGGTGAGGGLERASTVRFYCGNNFGITVNEDHTCHYIVTVLVPALCGHPLFRAPISKKQIMKCLPVEED